MKEKGIKIITISSIEGMNQKSRYALGLKIDDLADVAIDNMEDEGETTFVTSDIKMNQYNLWGLYSQELSREIAKRYLEDGKEPQVFRSGNVDHADEINQGLYDEIIKKAW